MVHVNISDSKSSTWRSAGQFLSQDLNKPVGCTTCSATWSARIHTGWVSPTRKWFVVHALETKTWGDYLWLGQTKAILPRFFAWAIARYMPLLRNGDVWFINNKSEFEVNNQIKWAAVHPARPINSRIVFNSLAITQLSIIQIMTVRCSKRCASTNDLTYIILPKRMRKSARSIALTMYLAAS